MTDTVPKGKLRVVVTYLEMRAPPDDLEVDDPEVDDPSPEAGLSIEPTEMVSVPFYRELYARIGEAWLWSGRTRLDDAALGRIISDPATSFQILRGPDGDPAGYAEMSAPTDDVELAYFGLVPAFTGRGIGPWFLRQFLRRAWARRPRRVWLHTCSLDHPGALKTYRRAGFLPYREETVVQDDPRMVGLVPRSAGAHIPFAG